jgi:hypothetical protein
MKEKRSELVYKENGNAWQGSLVSIISGFQKLDPPQAIKNSFSRRSCGANFWEELIKSLVENCLA